MISNFERAEYETSLNRNVYKGPFGCKNLASESCIWNLACPILLFGCARNFLLKLSPIPSRRTVRVRSASIVSELATRESLGNESPAYPFVARKIGTRCSWVPSDRPGDYRRHHNRWAPPCSRLPLPPALLSPSPTSSEAYNSSGSYPRDCEAAPNPRCDQARGGTVWREGLW
jgi:hypothetical protein